MVEDFVRLHSPSIPCSCNENLDLICISAPLSKMSVLHIHPEVLALLMMKFKAKQAAVSVVALTFSLPMGANAIFHGES